MLRLTALWIQVRNFSLIWALTMTQTQTDDEIVEFVWTKGKELFAHDVWCLERPRPGDTRAALEPAMRLDFHHTRGDPHPRDVKFCCYRSSANLYS